MDIEKLKECISQKFTEDDLKCIVRKKTNLSDFVVRSIKFGSEAAKGDSYLSRATRFIVSGVSKEQDEDEKAFEVHVIAKSMSTNATRNKIFRTYDFFRNEIIFYEKVWSKLDQFQREKNVKNPITCVPLCLSSFTDGSHDFIAMEDLSFDGYEVFRRGYTFTTEETKSILQIFGRFHALSIAYKDQRPSEFEDIAGRLEETYFAEKFWPWYQGCFDKFCIVLRDAVKKQLPISYLEKLEQTLSADIYSEVVQLCATRGTFAVVTHGDCWAPNFLKKDSSCGDGISMDTKIIDFQLSRYASFGTDLMFIFLTCLDLNILRANWEDFLSVYHKSFTDFAEELGSRPDILTVDKLKKEIKSCGIFGFLMSMEANVMSLAEDDDVMDLEDLQDDQNLTLDTVWKIYPFEDEQKRIRCADFFKFLVDYEII